MRVRKKTLGAATTPSIFSSHEYRTPYLDIATNLNGRKWRSGQDDHLRFLDQRDGGWTLGSQYSGNWGVIIFSLHLRCCLLQGSQDMEAGPSRRLLATALANQADVNFQFLAFTAGNVPAVQAELANVIKNSTGGPNALPVSLSPCR